MTLGCFQWFKDTNSKANHNYYGKGSMVDRVVFNGSKILIRKQITTKRFIMSGYSGCFQWFKDTNSKANHNPYTVRTSMTGLFSMVQRY